MVQGSPVDALFFYGPEPGELSDADAAPLARLSEIGIDVEGAPAYIVVDRMMLEASRRGVVTNALGDDRRWGLKHQQELNLRRYENATGQIIARPHTLIARPHEVMGAVASFADRGETCVVKPTLGEGGEGLRVVRPGEPFHPSDVATVVVQRLVPDPLLVKGHKADIRCYLLIDVDEPRRSGRVGPVFLRRAAVPYVAGHPSAEITNTSYRYRHGLAPDMFPLDQAPGISPGLHGEILGRLEALATSVVDAYFWSAANDVAAGRVSGPVPNRVILFGVDVLVSGPPSSPELRFLEVNPFPSLYRGLQPCDVAVDDMISRQYLPALLRSRVRR
jgi:hypothetical protein